MTSPLRPEDPARIGGYTLTARIGAGGQGTVYLGRSADGDEVAVKVLNGDWGSDSRALSRFAKEVAATRRVAAFCTAAVRDVDLESDPPYIASEYVAGPTLREAVRKDGPRTGSALDRLAIATATALVAIHQAGVVHRDLKPANVLLGADGPRVIDFGIARATDATITQTGRIIGTPAYMAPEQIRGRPAEPPIDVFAWAGVIVFAASGTSPFASETLPAVINRVLNDPPALDAVPDSLKPLLAACLDKDAAKRPTAVQVLGMLVGHDPVAVRDVPVTLVMEDGYQAATREQTRVAPTAALVALAGLTPGAVAAADTPAAAGASAPDPGTEGTAAPDPGTAATVRASAAAAASGAPDTGTFAAVVPPDGGTSVGAGTAATVRAPDTVSFGAVAPPDSAAPADAGTAATVRAPDTGTFSAVGVPDGGAAPGDGTAATVADPGANTPASGEDDPPPVRPTPGDTPVPYRPAEPAPPATGPDRPAAGPGGGPGDSGGPPPQAPAAPPRRVRPVEWALGVVLVLALCGALGWFFLGDPLAGVEPEDADPASDTSASPSPSPSPATSPSVVPEQQPATDPVPEPLPTDDPDWTPPETWEPPPTVHPETTPPWPTEEPVASPAPHG